MACQIELCAEESEKTKKARVKLKKRLEKLEKEIQKNLQDNIKKKIIEIHDRISRHAAFRVVLKRKSICLFDNNINSAEISNKVYQIAKKIKENNAIFINSLKEGKKKLNNYEINIV